MYMNLYQYNISTPGVLNYHIQSSSQKIQFSIFVKISLKFAVLVSRNQLDLLSLRSDNSSAIHRRIGIFRKTNPTFFQEVPTSRVFNKKSLIFFSCQGLVEISSKMRSFVDILILGHPIPYLLRGSFLEIDHFWNFAVVIYVGNFQFLKKFPEVEGVWGDLKSKYRRKISFLKRSRLDLDN